MIRKLIYIVFIACALGNRVVYGLEDASRIEMDAGESPSIEEVTIKVSPIFDEKNPKENNFLFRLVNRLHIDTKHHVIEKDLTFKKGDYLDKHLLEESERRLRTRRYLSDATMRVVESDLPAADTSKKVQVNAREVWALVPKFTYSTSGGSTHYGYGLHDSNFLGLGKSVKIEHSSAVERTSDILAYRDPNFLNKKELQLSYSDNSDGMAQELHFSNPFRSIRTPWMMSVDLQDFEREDTLYSAGEEVERFGHDGTYYALGYGRRLDSSTDDRVRRWVVGMDNVTDNFFLVPENNVSFANSLPVDRDYTVAWIEYSSLHNQFFEATNIQQINRVEDINLGSELRLRLGAVVAPDSELDKSVLVRFDYSKAYTLTSSQLLRSQLSSSGFYGASEAMQSITQVNFSYHWKNFERGQFFVLAKEVYGKNLFIDTPIELGGETGLRGYPSRFMAGDRLSLLTLEQRYFGETEWFSLFHLGAAVFYDQGRVWGNASVPQTYQSTMRDLGIGLRISGTRTGGRDEGIHSVAHIDLAYPLDGGAKIDKYQFSVHIKTSF